jgi:hypothetical protein
MRDPHIVALHYRVATGESVAFDNPPPLERDTEAFRIRLADGVLAIEMKEHYASETEARKRVQPYIRAWEIKVALQLGLDEMSFVFDRADIVDRNSVPPGTPQAIILAGTGSLSLDCKVILRVTRRQYPEPPDAFVVSSDVETMWNRYEGYKAGREPLASMAFMCLTVIESSTRERKAAAKQYAIDKKVLSNLGHLTSKVGDKLTARKMPEQGRLRPHADVEKIWIESVVKALIQRAGEYASDPGAVRPQLTMADFPVLPQPVN